MTDDIVEKVARAIKKAPTDGNWSHNSARAAIAALEAEGYQKVPEGWVLMPSSRSLRMMDRPSSRGSIPRHDRNEAED